MRLLPDGDTGVEANETFNVTLSSVTGATLGDGNAVGTIVNDDAAAALAPTKASAQNVVRTRAKVRERSASSP